MRRCGCALCHEGRLDVARALRRPGLRRREAYTTPRSPLKRRNLPPIQGNALTGGLPRKDFSLYISSMLAPRQHWGRKIRATPQNSRKSPRFGARFPQPRTAGRLPRSGPACHRERALPGPERLVNLVLHVRRLLAWVQMQGKGYIQRATTEDDNGMFARAGPGILP